MDTPLGDENTKVEDHLTCVDEEADYAIKWAIWRLKYKPDEDFPVDDSVEDQALRAVIKARDEQQQNAKAKPAQKVKMVRQPQKVRRPQKATQAKKAPTEKVTEGLMSVMAEAQNPLREPELPPNPTAASATSGDNPVPEELPPLPEASDDEL